MLFYTAYSVFIYLSKPYINCDRFIFLAPYLFFYLTGDSFFQTFTLY